MNEPQSTAPNATIASSNSSVSAEADAVRVSKDVNVPNASQAPALTLGVLARWTWLVGAVALLACLFLWQKINGLQEILARQTFDATAMAQEAKGLAKEAAELSRDSAAHLSLMQTQLSEVSLQRTQLESLMQTLTRTRDENTLDELESSVRLAQQQAQLTGSLTPLLTAMTLARSTR